MGFLGGRILAAVPATAPVTPASGEGVMVTERVIVRSAVQALRLELNLEAPTLLTAGLPGLLCSGKGVYLLGEGFGCFNKSNKGGEGGGKGAFRLRRSRAGAGVLPVGA